MNRRGRAKGKQSPVETMEQLAERSSLHRPCVRYAADVDAKPPLEQRLDRIPQDEPETTDPSVVKHEFDVWPAIQGVSSELRLDAHDAGRRAGPAKQHGNVEEKAHQNDSGTSGNLPPSPRRPGRRRWRFVIQTAAVPIFV